MSRDRKVTSLSSVRPPAPTSGEGASADAVALLRRIVAAQGEIAAAGPDPQDVVDAITSRAQALTRSAGAVLEIRDGDLMRYWSASGIAHGQVGLALPVEGSLSGRCISEACVLRCVVQCLKKKRLKKSVRLCARHKKQRVVSVQ